MKTALFGFTIAALILVSAAAHALLGWPTMRAALETQAVDPHLTGALAAGWYFGSASMLAFASIIAVQATRRLQRATINTGTLYSIAAAYILFGTVAFIARSFNPHFLLFVLTGVLVAAFTVLASRSTGA